MNLSEFLGRFEEVVEEPDGYLVPCPAHDDSRPSLRVALSEGEGKGARLLLYCRAGCETRAVVDALGLKWSDLYEVEAGPAGTRPISARVATPGPRDIAALAVYVGETSDRLQGEDAVAVQAREYLWTRFGVDQAMARTLGLGVDPGGNAHGFERLSRVYRRVPRVTVPFRDFDGVARGLQARDLTGRDPVRWAGLSNPEGAAWAKVAVFDVGTGLDVLIVTEGPGDGLTAAGMGYDALAIRGAALANASVLEGLLPRFRDRLVILAGDRDGAGETFDAKMAAALAEHGIPARRLVIPPEPVDGDLSGWRAHDPEGFADSFHAAVRAAQPVGSYAPKAKDPAPEPERKDYARTDLGNAERLFDHLDGLVRYSPEVGFYLYDGAVWVQDRYDAVRAAAHEVTREMVRQGEALRASGTTADEEAGKRLISWGNRSQSTRSIDAMVRELAAMPRVVVDVERMDAHHHLLAFRNGTVNLKTGDLRPHDPVDLITRRVDVDFDPAAEAPTWDYFLESVFPDHPDLPAYMRRLVGYGITGETVEQCFAVLWGMGSNGKSVFTDTLTEVFRSITVTTPFSTFEERPSGGIPNDLAALKGARLVMASEGDRGKPMAEAIIKRVTGADLISARFMRKEFFEFRPTFLIFMATNYKPNFRGQDEGLWRRVKLVPFTRYFAPHERDHYLAQKLRAEAQGIAAWAVKGAMEWYRHGLGDPPVVQQATREYRETSDALAGFFPGVLVKDSQGSVLGSDAYQDYLSWAEEEGLPSRERWTRRTFYGAMEERGIGRVKRAQGVTLLGVRHARPDETAEAGEAHTRAAQANPAHLPGTSPTAPQAPSLDDIEEA